MNKHLLHLSIALLVASACGTGDSTPATRAGTAAAPTPTRGYLPDRADGRRSEARRSPPPEPAAPLDPAEVGPDQPENVRVNP